MAIGATIKVGMDASAVRRGMMGIRGMFGGLAGTVGRLGRGIGRVSAIGGGLLLGGGILMTREVMRVAELGSEMSDMALQTGLSVRELTVLQQALQLAGADVADTSRMLSLFAANMQEAQEGSNAVSESLLKLGLAGGELQGMDLAQQFRTVMQAIGSAGDDVPIERIAEALFGARMGFRLIRFAKSYNQEMERAGIMAENQARAWEENVDALDRFHDNIGAIRNQMMALKINLVSNLPMDDINRIMTAFAENPEGFIKRSLEVAAGTLQEFGRNLGRGIILEIKDEWEALKGEGAGGFLRLFNPFASPFGKGSDRSEAMLQEQKRTNQILSRGGGAVFS